MQVIGRHFGEQIDFKISKEDLLKLAEKGDCFLRIMVVEMRRAQVKLGIDAPQEVIIKRNEICQFKK
jgi:hypothetical protein